MELRIKESKDAESLVKIYVDLPNHAEFGSESMWAKPLGSDRYEIRNNPFYAYGLNFMDIVIAVPNSKESKPAIKSVFSKSGHTALRVIFLSVLEYDERIRVLENLKVHKCFFEGANKSYFSLDIEPDGNLKLVKDILDKLESQNILGYETCEQKEQGHFGPAPE
jgi:hypothetical protein